MIKYLKENWHVFALWLCLGLSVPNTSYGRLAIIWIIVFAIETVANIQGKKAGYDSGYDSGYAAGQRWYG